MKQKLRNIIDALNYDELIKLYNELNSGGKYLKNIVKDKINEIEEKEKKICVVCEKNIDPYCSNYFTLIFGPPDFKKKASFCAIDCLEYFLNNLRSTKYNKGDSKEDIEKYSNITKDNDYID